jgi:hypothetical protein
MSTINTALNRLKHWGPLRRVSDTIPTPLKASMRRSLDRISEPRAINRLVAELSQTNDLLAAAVYENARQSPRMLDRKRLVGHGFKVYSQHDEDGIIEEIFRRIGETNRFFIEFGVGDGLENCTTYCLLKGWHGVWIDGSAACYQDILKNMAPVIDSRQLSVLHAFITAENIQSLFERAGIQAEFDLLSIDIDFNDYWVWKAIIDYRPRVVAIEYNASFQRSVACVVPYTPTRIWDYTNYYGSSLKALEKLGSEKGYRLVGCNYTGVTAFFVRDDLVEDRFCEPFTAENHFEPARYFVRMPNGHAPGFGPVERLD